MKNSPILLLLLLLLPFLGKAQNNTFKDGLKFNINESGSHFFQITFLNQTWLRFNQNNPGTLVQSLPADNSFDIGLRRTRIQMFGQINDRTFIYFQFGQNNFNAQFNATGNRKLAAFFHDALCEYKVSKENQLKIGGGLTIANGLSRFSQPSIGTIMTMDVPVFLQTTVDQTDNFSRKLSVYMRGQVGKFDYRFVLSDPFPITSNGNAAAPITENATFAQKGHHLQTQGYLMYQFFDHEGHTTPYMTGTHLGKKKVFNIAIGAIYQKNAVWKKDVANDTIYQAMQHLAIESYLDMPINKEKGTALSAFAGYFLTNYGTNYLRYNGIMNPANATTLNAANSITGQGSTYGNAYPMFGTGNVIYAQIGYLLPDNFLKMTGKLMPYASASLAKYDRLGGLSTNTYNLGINYLVSGHKSKITLNWENRPTYQLINSEIKSGERLNCVLVQYQIFF